MTCRRRGQKGEEEVNLAHTVPRSDGLFLHNKSVLCVYVCVSVCLQQQRELLPVCVCVYCVCVEREGAGGREGGIYIRRGAFRPVSQFQSALSDEKSCKKRTEKLVKKKQQQRQQQQ